MKIMNENALNAHKTAFLAHKKINVITVIKELFYLTINAFSFVHLGLFTIMKETDVQLVIHHLMVNVQYAIAKVVSFATIRTIDITKIAYFLAQLVLIQLITF